MGPFFLWNNLHEVELNLDWVILFRQSDPLAHSMDMGIDHDPGYVKGIPQDDIGCLPSYPGEDH